MKFAIYGCSDDLVEFEGDIHGEAGSDSIEISIGPPGRCALVEFWYARPGTSSGVWECSIRQNDEGEPLPGTFTIRRCDNTGRRGEAGYSVVLEVEVPDGTPVVYRDVSMPGDTGRKGDEMEWQVPS